MSLSKRRLVIVIVLTMLVTLVATFPARVAYRMADAPGIAVSGIDGTVWNGTAREASVNGSYVRDLEWKFLPARLLSGKLAYRVSADPANGFLDGEVGAGAGGAIALKDLQGSLPASMFEPALQIPGMRGTVNIDFSQLDLKDGIPVVADGTVRIADLVVPIVSRGSIGGYKAEFSTQDSGIVASVEDTDGVVDLAASLQIRPDRSYAFTGLVIAKPSAPDSLRQQLRFLGPANARGQHELRLEGQL